MLFRGIPVFIDSRADLYAPEFNKKEDIFMDFINTSSIATFYEDTFKKYNITHVIVYENSKVNMIIKKQMTKTTKTIWRRQFCHIRKTKCGKNKIIIKGLNAKIKL